MTPVIRAARIPDHYVHGFTTRHGGVSTGKYASFNLGGKWGDDVAALETNRQRLAEYGGFGTRPVVLARQVHKADVVRARDVTPDTEADAVLAVDEPMVCGVLHADCVPVLLADLKGRACVAIHSGWRGTVANIVAQAVEALSEFEVRPESIVAAIGPCIEQRAFEVGAEVAEHFPEQVVDRSSYGKPHVDLVAMIGMQLHQVGVTAVERVGGCTYENPDDYFSYRRDGSAGQMLSFIGARPQQ